MGLLLYFAAFLKWGWKSVFGSYPKKKTNTNLEIDVHFVLDIIEWTDNAMFAG